MNGVGKLTVLDSHVAQLFLTHKFVRGEDKSRFLAIFKGFADAFRQRHIQRGFLRPQEMRIGLIDYMDAVVRSFSNEEVGPMLHLVQRLAGGSKKRTVLARHSLAACRPSEDFQY